MLSSWGKELCMVVAAAYHKKHLSTNTLGVFELQLCGKLINYTSCHALITGCDVQHCDGTIWLCSIGGKIWTQLCRRSAMMKVFVKRTIHLDTIWLCGTCDKVVAQTQRNDKSLAKRTITFVKAPTLFLLSSLERSVLHYWHCSHTQTSCTEHARDVGKGLSRVH